MESCLFGIRICFSAVSSKDVLTTGLTAWGAHSSLRASGLLHSRCRDQFPPIIRLQQSKSKEKLSVLSRCSRVGVSSSENAAPIESPERFFEMFKTCSDPAGVFKVLERNLSSEERGRGEDDGAFNWLAQWYPVGVLKHMDKRQPQAVTVLGRDLVLWWDRVGGEWQVFADICPHRQAPLSEGRIDEQGHLQCSYHGWSFAPSSGSCTRIPQAPPGKLQIKDSQRACAKVYHSQEHQGMLFVYMDISEGAKERGAANPPPTVPLLDDPDFVHDMGMSDLSYSYDTLVENVLDPAHIPFAHHNILDNRGSGKPMDFVVHRFGKAGFWGGSKDTVSSMIFAAPSLVTSAFCIPPPSSPGENSLAVQLRDLVLSKVLGVGGPNMRLSTVFFCVPMTPGKSRLFFALPRNFARAIHHWMPVWLDHQQTMKVLDSDMHLLHLMERQIEAGGGPESLHKLFYTPTAADTFVVSWRRWLKKCGGLGPDYGPKASDGLPPSPLKTTLMDRRSSHVDRCSFCSGALRNFNTLETLLHVMPVALVGLAAASGAKIVRSWTGLGIPLICLAVVSSLASRWLSTWTKKHFEFHDYNHALVK